MNFNVKLPEFKSELYNILNYGAVEGGVESVTDAINTAIMECSKNGGGKVIIPRGLWLTGPIFLKSNVCLTLEDGAYVTFSKNKEDYPIYHGNWEGIDRLRATSPINIKDCNNVAIVGNGIMDGNGDLWRGIKKWKVTEKEWQRLLKKSTYVLPMKETEVWYPTKTAYEGVLKGESTDILEAREYYDYYRPDLVLIRDSDTILLDGVTFENSPAWNVHPLFSSNLTIRNCFIRNSYAAQNGDGLDVESCRYVHIHHNKFQVGDDGICIKSGKNKEARKIKVPCEDVYIHDCDVFEAHGGFVVGSEMSRGVRNVTIENCNFIGTDTGVRFKSALGRGGVVSDILIKNIRMTNIKEEAFIFTMGYALTSIGVEGKEKVSHESIEDIPVFKDIKLENITCINAKKGISIDGINRDTISNITFNNVLIKCDEFIKIKSAKDIKLINTTLYNENNKLEYKNEVLEG